MMLKRNAQKLELFSFFSYSLGEMLKMKVAYYSIFCLLPRETSSKTSEFGFAWMRCNEGMTNAHGNILYYVIIHNSQSGTAYS